jgi:1,4-dihydroxy-2-naphthoate octaprenyltransferase
MAKLFSSLVTLEAGARSPPGFAMSGPQTENTKTYSLSFKLSMWLAATRPRTLSASVIPVIVGLSLAWRAGKFDTTVAAVTLLASVLIQVGTNVANDYYDFAAGADTSARVGPLRLSQSGVVEPRLVKWAAFGALALAAILGLYLVRVGGLPILAVGLFSLICGLAYSAGPYPLAYRGLGDPFAFLFFGVIAVTATVYLQAGKVDLLAFLASLPVATLVTAILVVNNLRDIPTDAATGKRTLAVRIGAHATRIEYLLLVFGAFASLPALSWLAGPTPLLCLMALPIAVAEIRALWQRDGAALNRSLAGTIKLHFVFGLLLALGFVA